MSAAPNTPESRITARRMSAKSTPSRFASESAFALGKLRHEIRLARDAQTIGVDHHVTDRARARLIENAEKIRMQGRLAAGELHQIGLAFACDQRVEHARNRRKRQVLRLLR